MVLLEESVWGGCIRSRHIIVLSLSQLNSLQLLCMYSEVLVLEIGWCRTVYAAKLDATWPDIGPPSVAFRCASLAAGVTAVMPS
jgi:hypothetical protein